MPFINVAVSDAKEPTIAPEGAYTLRVISATAETSKSGKDMVHCILGFEGTQEYAPVHHYLIMPSADDEYRVLQLNNIKRFLVAFAIPFEGNGFDLDDFAGAVSAQPLLVTQEARKDAPDQINNRLNLPRVKDEVEEKGSRRRA